MSNQYKANRQYELLEFLRSPQPPYTVDEMADCLGCTHATAWVYLKKLENEGLITRKAKSVRSVRVTTAGRSFQAPKEVPVIRKTANRRLAIRDSQNNRICLVQRSGRDFGARCGVNGVADRDEWDDFE